MIPTIGSSDVPTILGYNRFQTPWDLWPKLMGIVPRYDGVVKAHQRTGHAIEKLLLPTLYRERFNVNLIPGPALGSDSIVGPEEWMHSHHDFERSDDGSIVEAKKVRSWEEWGDDGTDNAPLGYICQVVWQQICYRRQDAQIAAFSITDEDFRVYDIPWRENLARNIFDAVKKWYEKHIIGNTPPDIDGSDSCAKNISAVYPGSRAKIWRNPTEEETEIARELSILIHEMDSMTEKRNLMESKIKGKIGDDYGIRGIARWSKMKNGGRQFRFFYNHLEEEVD